MQIYLLFALIHILAVISAMGASATYQFWYSRAGLDRDRLVWVIDNVGLLERRIANPSYAVAFVAGVATVLTGPYSFGTLWIAAAIAIYIVLALIGALLAAPVMRRRRELAMADPTTSEYAAVAGRARMLSGISLLLVVVIAVLMVLKPTL